MSWWGELQRDNNIDSRRAQRTDTAHKTGRSGRTEEFYGGKKLKLSNAFPSKYDGFCERCQKRYQTGDYIRFHTEFGYVHDGCKEAHEADETPDSHYTITGAREPALCGQCFTYHNGECP